MRADDAPARTGMLQVATIPLDPAPVGSRTPVVTPATPAVSEAAVIGGVALSTVSNIVVGIILVVLEVELTKLVLAATTTTLVDTTADVLNTEELTDVGVAEVWLVVGAVLWETDAALEAELLGVAELMRSAVPVELVPPPQLG